ncbi:hypothetical protein [Prevotella sp. HUN102]|uniref:hypothetical protein n=1 Tax=Prevotella sp. HUN102 TaxID=1392486 RepID=UPI00048E81D6|nr:hypothetical protein [Prevotella sp. HUN102]
MEIKFIVGVILKAIWILFKSAIVLYILKRACLYYMGKLGERNWKRNIWYVAISLTAFCLYCFIVG